MNKILIWAIIGIILPVFVFSHGTEYEEIIEVNGYIVEFSRPLSVVHAQDLTTFTFRLEDIDARQSGDFDRLFVRLEDAQGNIILSADIAESTLPAKTATLNYALPEEGEYSFNLIFYKDSSKLAEASFALSADPPFAANDLETEATPALYIVAALAIGVAGWFAGKKL